MIDISVPLGLLMGAGFSAKNAIERSSEKTSQQISALTAEVTALKRELRKLQTPETLATALKIRPSRLPLAKQTAKALGMDVSELPELAIELGVTPWKLIAACTDPSPATDGSPRGPIIAEVIKMDMEFCRRNNRPLTEASDVLKQ